jgi:hypothetical protein
MIGSATGMGLGAARGWIILKRIQWWMQKSRIEGVSRYGKAALVTLAFEPRFAVGLIGSSGKGGATLHRRVFGEAVESLTGSGGVSLVWRQLPEVMCIRIRFWSKTGCDLPVDSHELIALCAPRLTFISYGIPRKAMRNGRPTGKFYGY